MDTSFIIHKVLNGSMLRDKRPTSSSPHLHNEADLPDECPRALVAKFTSFIQWVYQDLPAKSVFVTWMAENE